MSKRASQYTPTDVYELEARLLRLACELSGEQADLVREGAGVLLNQAVRLAQIRLTLEVKG